MENQYSASGQLTVWVRYRKEKNLVTINLICRKQKHPQKNSAQAKRGIGQRSFKQAFFGVFIAERQIRDFYLPQQFLYFLPLPHGHGSFRPTFGIVRRTVTLSPCERWFIAEFTAWRLA